MAETDRLDTGSDSDRMNPSWGQVWHLPVLLLGMALLVFGVYFALPSSESDNFPVALDEVKAYLVADNPEAADAMLARVEARIERAGREDRARATVLRGDVWFAEEVREQRSVEPRVDRIINAYEQAAALGYDLDSDAVRLERIARMHTALGRTDDALAVLDRLERAEPHRRYRILQRIIEQTLEGPIGAAPTDLIELVMRYRDEVEREPDEAKRRQGQVWGLATQARLYLENGEADRALDFLNPRRAALASTSGEDDLASLIVLQAEALRQTGDYEAADAMFRFAQLKLAPAPTDPLHAEILVGQARIALAYRGEVEAALELFREAATRFPTAPVALAALIGKADCEARSGADARAQEGFRDVVARFVDQVPREARTLRSLVDTILTHYQRHFDTFRYDEALRYLQVLPSLFSGDPPTDLVARFATTHERLGVSLLERGSGADESGPATAEAADDALEARRTANREAAVHFGHAARYYRDHADAVTVSDDQAHGTSLWNASVNFDRARLWDDAIEVLSRFQSTRASDPRRIEAAFMLAMTHKANGGLRVAVEHFERLIREHPKTRQAHASRVPLARCHIALDQLSRALAELNYVVGNNDVVTPDSKEYLVALIELGKLHYRMEEYEPAISRLQEAVDREPQHEEIGLLHAYLGDAYRMSISQLDADLAETATRSRSMALTRERTRRLEAAKASFGTAIERLEAQDPDIRTPLEDLYLRNAYFYRADSDFTIGRYAAAIDLYHAAIKRWDQHPAALVGWMQIVNAHCALKQFQEARVELGNAQFALQRMPDEAFDDPNLPINREHWRQWFQWTSELGLYAQTEVEGGG